MNQNDFVQIINPFREKIFRLAKRLLISTEEAEDATQEVLVKLWQKKNALNDYKSIEALAMTITKNHCLDQLKSKRAGNLQLPEQQRIIIQLRDIEQYEFSEIAKIIDISEIAIRVALSRARKTIREKMLQTHNYGIR